jgi:hypothetical protein
MVSGAFILLKTIKRIWIFWQSVRHVFPILTKYRVNLLRESHSGPRYQIFGTALIHSCGQTDRQTDEHDEANRHFSRLCESA